MSFFTMTKTLIKSIFHGPYTVRYPLEKKEPFLLQEAELRLTYRTVYSAACVQGAAPPVPLMLRSQNPDGA